jgi:secreted Zn-dependent insulinase-like peptidase
MFAAASSVSMIPPNVAQAGTLLENPRTETMATADFLDILKPPLDDREYVAYTLENGLRVLLCSDESSNEAAVALDVHVGACSDPAEVPGMAHFNEV